MESLGAPALVSGYTVSHSCAWLDRDAASHVCRPTLPWRQLRPTCSTTRPRALACTQSLTWTTSSLTLIVTQARTCKTSAPFLMTCASSVCGEPCLGYQASRALPHNGLRLAWPSRSMRRWQIASRSARGGWACTTPTTCVRSCAWRQGFLLQGTSFSGASKRRGTRLEPLNKERSPPAPTGKRPSMCEPVCSWSL